MHSVQRHFEQEVIVRALQFPEVYGLAHGAAIGQEVTAAEIKLPRGPYETTGTARLE